MQHYQRVSEIVWRVGSDRVLVRHVDTNRADDLFGAAAHVWIAAESPSSIADIAEFAHLFDDVVVEAVSTLIDMGWIDEVNE